MTKQKTILNITISSILLSLGYVLPFLTGNIPEIGSMIAPMHIPVFICGLVCGWKYGLIIGIILPLFRGVTIGAPVIYPAGLAMAIELGIYGLVTGLLKKNKTIGNIYFALVMAMISGRIAWGSARFLLTLLDNTLAFSFDTFIASAFIMAWPGIIIQLLIIPPIIIGINKLSFIKFLDQSI